MILLLPLAGCSINFSGEWSSCLDVSTDVTIQKFIKASNPRLAGRYDFFKIFYYLELAKYVTEYRYLKTGLIRVGLALSYQLSHK